MKPMRSAGPQCNGVKGTDYHLLRSVKASHLNVNCDKRGFIQLGMEPGLSRSNGASLLYCTWEVLGHKC